MMMTGMIEIILLLLGGFGGQAGLPLGVPPGPEDANVLKFAPDDCMFYTSWSPTIAPDPKGNATERWMAQPEVVAAFEKIRSVYRTKAGEDPFGKTALKVAECMLINGAGVYVSELEILDEGPSFKGGAIVRLGPNAKQYLDVLMKSILSGESMEFAEVTEKKINGSKFYETSSQMPDEAPAHFGIVKDEYLAVTVGEGEMEKLLANLETDQPQWLAETRGNADLERISSVTYLNAAKLRETIKELAESNGEESFDSYMSVLGLDKLESAGWVAGLDDKGFLCRGRIKVDGPPTGLLDLFADEELTEEHMSRIADDRMAVVGASLSATKITDLFREVLDMQPFSRGELDNAIDQINAELGIDLQTDVLEKLDGQVYAYGSVNFAQPTAGWILSFRISDEDGFKDAYEKVVDSVRSNAEGSDYYEFDEKEINGVKMYTQSNTRGWGDPNISWAFANGEVLFSMDKGSIRKHLRREEMEMDALVRNDWFGQVYQPQRMDSEGPYFVAAVNVADVIRIGLPVLALMGGEEFERNLGFALEDIPSSKILTANMQPNLMSLFKTPDGFETVQRQTYPGGTPGTILGGAVIGGLAASATLRKAAAKTTSANNARIMVLAMHNYHDSNRAMPARFSKNAEDKPLLSWRVHILPFMGYDELYDEFRLDEPWDSDHNKTLLEKMPSEFKHPMMKLEEGKTAYLVAAGENTMLPDPSNESETPRGLSLERVSDGTSRTAIVFEVKSEAAVFWTQPEDLKCDGEDDPFESLYQGWDDGSLNIALADGSVRRLKAEKVKSIFKQLIQTNDGEIVDLSDD